MSGNNFRVPAPGVLKMLNRNSTTIFSTFSTPPVVVDLFFGNEKTKIGAISKFGCPGIQVHDGDWSTHYRSNVEPTKYFYALINVHAPWWWHRAAACSRR